jgi:hypothetical protein
VNGKAVPGLESVILGYTGGWRTWKKAEIPIALDLQAGRNTLRLTSLDETSVWLKRIRLTPVAGGGKEIDLEAIALTAQGGGQVQRTLVPKTGFLMADAKGHWLEWDVTASAAGEYKVFLVQGALVEAARELKVNGEKVNHPDNFKVAATGGWRIFTEVPYGTARLKEGSNVIRTENLTADGPNLASIRFVKDTGEEIVVKAVSFAREGGGKATKP